MMRREIKISEEKRFKTLKLEARKREKCTKCNNSFFTYKLKKYNGKMVCETCYKKLNKPQKSRQTTTVQTIPSVPVVTVDEFNIFKQQMASVISDVAIMKTTMFLDIQKLKRSYDFIHDFNINDFVQNLLRMYDLERFDIPVTINGKTNNFFYTRENFLNGNEPEIENDDEKKEVALLINRIKRGSREYSSFLYYIEKMIAEQIVQQANL